MGGGGGGGGRGGGGDSSAGNVNAKILSISGGDSAVAAVTWQWQCNERGRERVPGGILKAAR